MGLLLRNRSGSILGRGRSSTPTFKLGQRIARRRTAGLSILAPCGAPQASNGEYAQEEARWQWLDSGGGDWWIADPIYIHPEAKVLDFVFSNGEGTYDNAGGRDYHAPGGLEDGTLPPEEDHVAKREAILEEEQGPLDATRGSGVGSNVANCCPTFWPISIVFGCIGSDL